ncbi:Vps53-like domain-containing protein [Cavenderia fasciculata]|uniref:Vps53-like domain-containing protein n=1 Tax=Cavenderia fasciculata TaxID=261658 RepID=F4PIJ1_CACFS|nr:Vps53-like domain-containing protein [Cavenderia fasciculata]EGG24571.1 Vps53-like domain-containing protein [Cavenderia fasciculata]|eukprot:XP_004362422.1 Vps53-like domain-containing protein [Cavenderia fasciculata]
MDKTLVPPSLEGSVQWSNDMFSPSLQAAINDIIPSQDPIDRHDFNPVTFINDNFTSEQSLVHIDSFMNKLHIKIHKIDEEIIQEVRLQSSTGSKGKEDLENAKRSINELLTKIGDIKSKAIKSEQMVTEICKDIKSLDCAKKNLTTAITTLKRLHMMVTGTKQLKEMVDLKQYGRVANLLEATSQFADGFKDYRDSPKIASLYSELEAIRDKVKTQIYEDFRNYIPFTSNQLRPGEENRWKSACYVIDALGASMKNDFLHWFYDIQLANYKSAFGPGSEQNSLEYTKKRYSWLKRQLKVFSEEYANVFPPEWKMEEEITFAFCVATRRSLSDILQNNSRNIDITVLLNVLNITIEFEKHIYALFAKNSKESPRLLSEDLNNNNQNDFRGEEEEEEDEDEDEDFMGEKMENNQQSPTTNGVVESVSERYKQRLKKKEMERNESSTSLSSDPAGKSPTMVSKPVVELRSYERFKGIISQCFDPYMELYIKKEDQEFEETLRKLESEERWYVDEDAINKVLSSATDLIMYFRSAMDRCSTYSRGQTFYSLFILFKKYLSQYSTILSNKIHMDVGRIHEQSEDKTICFIINTSEYVNKTINQITERFKRVIDGPYVEKIDLKPEQNEFSSVIAKAIKSLVGGIEARLAPHMQTMTRIDWVNHQYVGDHSPYVDQILMIINDASNLIVAHLSTAHYKYFCDVFAASFIFSVTQSIYKCEKISEIGSQGILLDITTIKTCFLELPGKLKDGTSHTRYTNLVNKEFGKAEAILKVVGCPNDALVDTYNALIPEGSDKDFQKIMELKGIKAGDKTELLEKYINKVDKTLSSFTKFFGQRNINK